jgi:hypothetical protein
MQIIAQMPDELLRITMQSLVILFGTYATKGLYVKKKESEKDKISNEEAKQKVDCFIGNQTTLTSCFHS